MNPHKCANCGGPLPKGYRTHCKNPVCQRARQLKHKIQMREAWKRTGSTKRTPESLKPPYNPKPCRLCKQPLGRTFNRFYHLECHHKVSRLTGIEDQQVIAN